MTEYHGVPAHDRPSCAPPDSLRMGVASDTDDEDKHSIFCCGREARWAGPGPRRTSAIPTGGSLSPSSRARPTNLGNVMAWEKTALDLAARRRVTVPERLRCIPLAGRRASSWWTALIERPRHRRPRLHVSPMQHTRSDRRRATQVPIPTSPGVPRGEDPCHVGA